MTRLILVVPLALTLALLGCGAKPSPANLGDAKAETAAADPGELRAEASAATVVGTPAPALTVTTLEGAQLDLTARYGSRPVYLKFWATWCLPCRAQMPKFEQLFETLGDRVTVIAVNVGLDDDPAAVRAFRDTYGLRMPIVVDDGRLAAAFNLQVTPQHVLIDRSGQVAFIGHLDGAKLDRALAQTLAAPARTTGPPPSLALRPPLRPGDVATDLTVRTDDGTTVALGANPAHRPRAVVLFATWCEGYLAERQPTSSLACRRVRELVDTLRLERPDLDWIGVAHGLWTAPEDLPDYRARTHTQLPLALDHDGAIFRAFAVQTLATVALLDGDGKLLRLVHPDEDLRAAIAALPVAPR